MTAEFKDSQDSFMRNPLMNTPSCKAFLNKTPQREHTRHTGNSSRRQSLGGQPPRALDPRALIEGRRRATDFADYTRTADGSLSELKGPRRETRTKYSDQQHRRSHSSVGLARHALVGKGPRSHSGSSHSCCGDWLW